MNSQPGNPGVRSPFRTAAAMTLIEMMVTMSVFSLAMLAFLAIHIFGLKQDELIQSKLGASDQSRKSFDLITRDIRSAKIWRLGTVSGTTFTALTNGALQQAPGLQLSFTNDYTTNIMYYFTTVNGDNQLFRRRTGGTATVVASNLINTLTFSAQDYAGTIKSDLQWRYVIHFILQFRQFQYPLTQVGSNYLYDFYKLEFRATPHAPD